MVFYFTSNVVDPPVTLFMGLDKHESESEAGLRKSGLQRASILFLADEDLIRWGWDEDVWFHVDKVSSAHVYLRLAQGQSLDDVPAAVIDDAAQLVKANSIQGNKMNDVDVVYTMWANLHKTDGMDVGQVGFHKDKEVRKVRVSRRDNAIVNRLNKTKVEKTVDFREERDKRDRREREEKKRIFKKQEEERKEEERLRKEEAELRSYSTLMSEDKMTSNRGGGNDSDDFM